MQLTKQNQSLVEGSLYEIAKNNNQSIAESFINCDVVILVDTSGSMSASDSRDGQSRYDVACAELRALQGSLPGKIAVLSFSEHVHFCPTGLPIYQGSTTDMAKALQFAKVADGIPGMRFILISDGEPDSRRESLAAAKSYQNRIDVIYVGNESIPTGRVFLENLSASTGGKTITNDRAKDLSGGIQFLLAEGN